MIRILSDLHNEFSVFNIPKLDTDANSTLVLAGDIGVIEKPSSIIGFLEVASESFMDVIYVFGNHEYYGGSITRAKDKLLSKISHLSNVHILDDSSICLNGVTFIGSTLWTSFDNGDPLMLYNAKSVINDYIHIRFGDVDNPYKNRLTSNYIYDKHIKSLNYIKSCLNENRESGNKIVVVTHHAPSFQSIDDIFKHSDGGKTSGYYASNLEGLIYDTCPNLWIHGHTHNSVDYNIGDCLVITNPRGYYPDFQNINFKPDMVITI